MEVTINAQNAVDSGTLFASIAGVVLPLGETECVFCAKGSGETHIMTTQVMEALGLCRPFRTLDEHVREIGHRLPGMAGRAADVRRVLQHLIERKLLVDDASCLRAATQAPARPAAFKGVFVRACDEPELTRRVLVSLRDNERNFHGGYRYFLIDGSRRAETHEANRALLREFADVGIEAHYLGVDRRRQLLERLVKRLPEHAAPIGYLLGSDEADKAGYGPGKAYHLASLLAAGQRFSLLDGDCALPLRRHPDYRPGALIGEAESALFFEQETAAMLAGQAADTDPIQLHLRLCGHSLPDAALAVPEFSLARESLRGIALAELPFEPGLAVVLATDHGRRGNQPEERGMHWAFLLPPAERAQFHKTRESYLSHLQAPYAWSGSARCRIMRQCSELPFMLDNSGLLPPTLPGARDAGSALGALIALMRPEGAAMQLPLAAACWREPSRSPRAFAQALVPSLGQFVRDWLAAKVPDVQAADPAARCGAVAAALRDLAGASAARTRELLCEYVLFARADLIDRLQAVFTQASDAPLYWQADVREIIAQNGKTLAQPLVPRLAEWPSDFDDAQCVREFGAQIGNFAEALAAWPRIRQAASEDPDWVAA